MSISQKSQASTLPLDAASFSEALDSAIRQAQDMLLRHQFPEGYWWYTLEANETIGAEYIFLREFLAIPDPKINHALCRRMLSQQRADGSWAIYFNGPGDLSATVECYWALKLSGFAIEHPAMIRAREFIRSRGGPTQVRVFTKIHLAMFGLAPWSAAPAMPYVLMMMPNWAPVNIYEFSSWARACIVPLLIILNEKYVHKIEIDLEELYLEPPSQRDWSVSKDDGDYFSIEKLFFNIDKILKNIGKIKKPQFKREAAIQRCTNYIREHIEKTEDIYPALAYAAMALKTLGYDVEDPTLAKALRALNSFQQLCEGELKHIPRKWQSQDMAEPKASIHQQCCISPVWDTPWAAVSLTDSGFDLTHPALRRAADWLVSKQITTVRGDWAVKNKKAEPGGWSFEFQNDYFPDVDDTIEVLTLFHKLGHKLALPSPEIQKSFELGLNWLWSMQSKNGGWAAFDVDNTLNWVNHIPFSDHGACLDPPTPDITGRMLEFLALIGTDRENSQVQRALRFIYREQTPCGAWEGRWGVNYLYGTWCVLQGLAAIGENLEDPRIAKARDWLIRAQNPDGGWGESCAGYLEDRFTPLPYSVPSQSAWAVMGLIAAGQAESSVVTRGIEFLLNRQNSHGCWDEAEYTGTGFPGHFYIRYHGYRHYFPLLALGKYRSIKSAHHVLQHTR
ncbi:MAG TPA: squalene--hopene cyclase [Deltaproteobacteria bacterium]|nr:squalene--hopene cyclase [Deltaproteobacteria bacterium]